MNDVDRLILEAWEKLGPGIVGDSDELNRRLARRRMAILTRPVRAWCLAVRASDRRITPAHWVIYPEHAMDLNHPLHPYEPIEHQVTIQPHALRRYCRPVRTDSWGEEVHEVAQKLGVTPQAILNARWAGVFTERIVRGLGGKRGKNVPLIHSWKTLDPSGSYHFSRPEQLWGSLWEFLPDMIPDDFEQTLVRIPKFNGMTPKDHPGRDCGEGRQFIGWRWICPGCRKKVRKIFYPLPPRTLFDFLGGADIPVRHPHKKFKKCQPYDVDERYIPPPSFACSTCHGVANFSRLGGGAWNQVVTHLTTGLLYGREVQKPTWYRFERKRPRTRILHGRPAPKREAIFLALQKGHITEQIALDLLISKVAVQLAINHICKQERVKNRTQLAAKLGWPHPQPLNGLQKHLARAKAREEQVLPLLLQELSYSEIARRTGMSRLNVKCAAKRIYRKHRVPIREGLKGLARKLNIDLTPRFTAHAEIRTRLLAGQRICDIACALSMQPQMVANRCAKIYKKHGVTTRKDFLAKQSPLKSNPIAPALHSTIT